MTFVETLGATMTTLMTALKRDCFQVLPANGAFRPTLVKIQLLLQLVIDAFKAGIAVVDATVADAAFVAGDVDIIFFIVEFDIQIADF